MRVVRRTFEALKFPAGSERRAKLNESVYSSEYMPSYKWMLMNDDNSDTPFNYRTKREAEMSLKLFP